MKILDFANRRLLSALLMMHAGVAQMSAADIKGVVVDKATGETLIGATVTVDGKGTVTDVDGHFSIMGIDGKHRQVTVNYVGYKPVTLFIDADKGDVDNIRIEMVTDTKTFGEVQVTATVIRNTEQSTIEMVRNNRQVANGVSAQEIKRSQDSNVGEVVRRVPGVSLIDDKFVMVRGLSQRYNNVWLNGGAVPSSEADSRAFSFDMIPSSLIDNLMIVKSPGAEYPSDFSGGFISICTKDIPASNSFAVNASYGIDDRSSFRRFVRANHGTSFPGAGKVGLTGSGLCNDWHPRSTTPVGDYKIGADWSRRWRFEDGMLLGLTGVVSYGDEWRSLLNMTNNLFGVYDYANGRSNYLRQSVDDQYNHNQKLGAMLNFALLSSSGNNKYQLKNIINRIVNRRYTSRSGINAQSDNETGAEYFYRSRLTLNSQLSGKHTRGQRTVEWCGSYSYANRYLPDRRRYTVDDALQQGTMMLTAGNEINREFTKLNEHIASARIDLRQEFEGCALSPVAKVGAYGEYRTRDYNTRQFVYGWNTESNTLPSDFRQMDMTQLLSDPQYFGDDKLWLLENMCMRNNYSGNDILGAGYATVAVARGPLSVEAGVRYEYNRMELVTNTRDDMPSPNSRYYRNSDFFPSLNATYKTSDKSQVRLSYGKSVNRPEFREVSPSVYYDFDLASHVQGNVSLKSCYVHNADLRLEYYPSKGELVTLAAFYKHFANPIEWTYTVAGGTSLVYSYENAKSADNVGVELEVRKSLAFIGLKEFALSMNASAIHSRVNFPSGSRNEGRPMQGQSPYLVNMGLFYNNEAQLFSVSLLYNRIGKRIIGVGRSEGSTSGGENARVPDSYEMPRDVLDLNISKKIGKHVEIKAGVRDILAQSVNYLQFTKTKQDGGGDEVRQTTRHYRPGRNFSVSASVRF